MWKKALLLFSLFTFTVAVTAPLYDSADARPKSFRSGTKSFSKTPAQSNNTYKSSTTKSTTGSTANGTTKPGLFGGGSFLKGMMIGGLAGMLFGSMFGTGFMANMLGFMVNLLALIALFWVIRTVFSAIRRRRDSQRPNYPHERRW